MGGLSGNLEDISIVDVLQILGMSGKSGVLRLQRDGRSAEVVFSTGRIVSAGITPHLIYMADLLVERGEVDLDTLHEALRVQRSRRDSAPIGKVLIEMEAVTPEQVESALSEYVQTIINEVASWTDGAFSFETGEPNVIDGFSFLPETFRDRLSLSPQEVLLEAARISDEARAEAPTPLDEEGGGAPDELKEDELRRSIVLFTSNMFIRQALKNSTNVLPMNLKMPVTIAEARNVMNDLAKRSPLLVVDTDVDADGVAVNEAGIEVVEELRRAYPDVPMISFGQVEDPTLFGRALSAGVLIHVPRPPTADESDIVMMDLFVSTLVQSVDRALYKQKLAWAMMPGGSKTFESAHRKDCLKDVYLKLLDVRRSPISFDVSVDVLDFVARHFERAIMFYVRDHELTALGVFGMSYEPADLRRSASALSFTVQEKTTLAEVLDSKLCTMVTKLKADPILSKIYERVGPPAREEACLLPLVVNSRTIAIVYADNGDREDELYPWDAAGVMMENAGLQMENMLLQHQLSRFEEP